MQINDLYPASGASRERKRIGRGHGSGQGKTAGKGHKGQWARSGGGVRPGFEGGQTSLARRIPKRGFNNIFGKKYAVVNLLDLMERFEDGAEITAESIMSCGLIKKPLDGIKILSSVGYTETEEGIEEQEFTKKFSVKINVRRISKPNKSKKNPEAPAENEKFDLLLSKSAKEKIEKAGGSVAVV